MARRGLPLLVTVFLIIAPFALPQPPRGDIIAPAGPRTPEEEKKGFKLPPGFEAQLVAAEPDIAKPLNIAFDARGRLWVSDTVEYPFAAPPDRKARDSVKVLSDFGPDGKARKITTFADGLNIPIGVLPLVDEALVYSIPAIWKLTDTDRDGKADRRELLLEKYGTVDTHGMTNAFTLGFDGWVYACHGFKNDSTVKARDGSTVTMNSGNVYRFRPDGSHVEQVTWGQVNPFGLTLDPLGNLYSADCHSMPIYQLLRGAYYPSFGKPHDGLGFGPEMMSHQHYSTGIGGITYYAADHFPKEYQGNIFIGNVVTSRVNYDRIEWRGSSPWAVEKPDFIVSDDQWFRPVDIKLGPDGALYIADFYNKIIGHYEVDLKHPGRDRHRGRIWRIVYRGPDGKGAPAAPRADWTKASIAELVDDLGHPNLTVRLLATQQLTLRDRDDVVKSVRAVMKAEAKPTQRAHAVWVLARLGSLDEATLRTALGDKEAIVRVHTCRVLVEQDRLSAWQHDALLERVTDENANVVRAAAEALGHHPDARNVARLLRALREAEPRDSHLRHVVRIALRDTLRGSKPDALPNKLEGEDRLALASVLLGIGSRDGALGLIALLKGGGLPQGELPRLAGHVARHGRDADVDDLVATLVPRLGDDLRPQGAIFRAIDQGTRQRGGRLGKKTHGWGVALEARLFASPQAQDVQEGIVLAGLLRSVDRDTTLARLLADHRSPQGHRLAAVDALAAIDAPRHVALFGRTVAEDPVTEVRLQAVGVLARLNTPESRTQLVNGLAIAPAALQTSIATALATSKEGGEALLQAVEAGKASARLLQEKGVDGFLRASKVRDVDGRTAKLTAGLPSADRKILDLIKKRRDGFATGRSDVVQGQKVFEKHCANCHQIASKGAKIGPQLDGVGIRGLDRILEDTLDPNRNVDQAFRTTTLNLKKGQVLSGLLLREEGAVLVLADNQGKEVRVNVDDVEERRLTPLSPMPANLAEQIPEAEFYHLLAYLLAQRVPGK